MIDNPMTSQIYTDHQDIPEVLRRNGFKYVESVGADFLEYDRHGFSEEPSAKEKMAVILSSKHGWDHPAVQRFQRKLARSYGKVFFQRANVDRLPTAGVSEVQSMVKNATLIGLHQGALYSSSDLDQARFAEIEWAIEGVLAIPGLALVVARPKTGKSFLVTQVALATITDGLLSGPFRVINCPTVMYMLEDSHTRMKGRLAMLDRLKKREQSDRRIYFRHRLPPEREQLLAELRKDIASTKAKLVIIDPLALVMSPSSSKSSIYSEEYSLMSAFREVAEDMNVGILVVHHSRKSPPGARGRDRAIDSPIGTTAISGAVDSIITIDRDETGGQGDFIIEINARDAKHQELAATFDAETGAWKILGDYEQAKEKRTQRIEKALSATSQAILASLEDGPKLPSQIADDIGKNASTVRGQLRAMSRDGKVAQTGEGTYCLPSRQSPDPQLPPRLGQ